MPVETIPPPVKYLSHETIRDRLKPYATVGWLKRFDAVKDRGQKYWLYVVRDFNIQYPRVEMVVEDIVRVLEVKKFHKSAVRDEMNALEAEGKLNLDTPEEEQRWEDKLQEEREVHKVWEADDHKARMEQRKEDIKAIEEKEKRTGETPTSPIAMKSQDPAQNESLKNEAKEPDFQIKPVTPTEPPIPKPSNKEIVVENPETKHTPPLENQIETSPEVESAVKASEEIKEKKEERKASSPTISADNPKHATELSEKEKKQFEFKPKPPPDKEPPITGPKLKKVVDDKGEVVYDESKKEEDKPKLNTVEGLPEDAIKRLNDMGIYTAESFSKMEKTQARKVLGVPLYTKLQDKITGL